MPAVFVALIALAGGITSALVGYLIARLVNSGKIETSTADRLWEEAGTMRQELRDQVVSQAAENAELRHRLAADERAHDEVTTELRRRLRVAEDTIEALRRQVGRVEVKQDATDRRIANELGGDAGHGRGTDPPG